MEVNMPLGQLGGNPKKNALRYCFAFENAWKLVEL
jgi:hypothetical protein